ncbi:stalk domain-containing protein [Paenibacillus glycanilyticus]|uniref:Copper amine oxidase-like N-terminal domain-containing protein n=1 Tax=Paenibacillus glycanilyticus TaxID=126569 RepID=A0ABQ6GFB3_9BACL|nr:stalk domain-containing protein [Paenibacillus glycanilyticus]GLX68021.1 hypothetical protein MU1_23660 [Paenibacillus glycanilyticus]
MKSKIVTSIIFALLLSLTTTSLWSSAAEAYDKVVQIKAAKMQNNRILIPLRSVSENMGATVQWDQAEQAITITKGNTNINLSINSQKVRVNETEFEMDVSPQLTYGVTYVPARFVSEAFGADVKWNQQTQQATITLDRLQMILTLEKQRVVPPSSIRITDQRLKLLVDQLNEATDLSAIKQIRSYFSPYFTDRFINSIIQNKGLKYNYKFKIIFQSGTSYIDYNTAIVNQASDNDSEYGSTQTLYRTATIVRTESGWKVDAVSFELVNEVMNP